MVSKIVKRTFFFFLVLAQTFVFSGSNNKNEQTKTVLLTGAAGFIGSNCLEYLYQTHENYHFIILDALTYAGNLENIPPHILNSSRVRFIKGSVVDFPLVDQLMSEANFVIHFAAETHVTRSIADDFVFFETDVLGTRAMMTALAKHSKTVERFIHISTSEVYGSADYIPMNEDHPLNPQSPYAAAKVGADRLVHAYNCTYNLPVVTVRPFNNFGPRQHLEKLIPRLITAAIQGKPLTIHGTGNQVRDWIYVKDVCVALDKILTHPNFSILRGQELNLGTGKGISVLEIAKMILKQFNLPETQLTFIGNRPGQVDTHIATFEKARILLNWTPTTDFKKGLEETIHWYTNNSSHWGKLEDSALIPIRTTNNIIEMH